MCINIHIRFPPKFDILTECVVIPSGKENQSQGDGSQVNGLQTEELTQLREEMEELRKQYELLQKQLSDKDVLINTLVSKCLRTVFRSS